MNNVNVQSSRYYKYLLDDRNIYLAIYSLESYIFDYGLLSREDKIEYQKLRDKFHETYILEEIIPGIREKIKKLILEKDYYIPVQVYFNPKKYEEGRMEYRPLHTTGLLYQMVIVAMMNLLIYEIPLLSDEGEEREKESGDKKGNRLRLSNLSRLIPGNFYGNRVSLKPEELFKPWKKQYQKYTSLTNEYLKKYHSSLEYKYEVTLDLENFFPSVKPGFLVRYIMERLPVNLTEEDRELYRIVIEKLLYCKVENELSEELWRYYYFGEKEILKKEEQNWEMFEKFSKGIPQGLPQSYFMGNIAMIPIAKEFAKQFPGVSLFYVDDSVIFTNEVKEQEFQKSIEELNSRWKGIFDVEGSKGSLDIPNALSCLEKLYEIKVHDKKKSYYTRLDQADNGEIFLMCLGREVSHAAADLFRLYSNEEDNNLRKKLGILSSQIEKKIQNLTVKMKSTDISKDIEGYQKMVQRLTRYHKFFQYRFMLLDLMETTDTKKLKDIIIVEEQDSQAFLEKFTDTYKNSIWGAAMSVYSRQITEEKERKSLAQYIRKVNRMVFGWENESCSYLYKMYMGVLDEDKDLETWENKSYGSLRKIVSKKLANYQYKHNHIADEYLEKLKERTHEEVLAQILSREFCHSIMIVDANTEDMFRMVLNAVYSCLFSVEIEDSFIIGKKNRKPLTYGELRVLLFLRNSQFTELDFRKRDISLKTYENQMPIDYSILEVTEAFRTFVGLPSAVDNLILTHQYICDLWRNGSKHLYFYTLHNQEHAIELIKNIIKIMHTFDYFQISSRDYYILFLACYLHDIAMVRILPFDLFLVEQDRTDRIALELKERLKKGRDEEGDYEIGELKKIIIEFYQKVDQFLENQVRKNHAFNSAMEIRTIGNLQYLDDCLREFIAEIAEAHAHDTSDIYFTKSDAKNKLVSMKFNKILLRLADALDISMYRISKPVLNHNLEQMPKEAAFHWISHLLVKGYVLEADYIDKMEEGQDENHQLLSPGSIVEHITLKVMVEMTQLSECKCDKKCSYVAFEKCEFYSEKKYVELRCGEACKREQKCNFLCKWFVNKNGDLLRELDALVKYLNRIPDNFFESEVSVCIEMVESTKLGAEEFEVIEEYLNKSS